MTTLTFNDDFDKNPDGVYIVAIQDGRYVSVVVTDLTTLSTLNLKSLVRELELALKDDICD